jgi:hypothetical protein
MLQGAAEDGTAGSLEFPYPPRVERALSAALTNMRLGVSKSTEIRPIVLSFNLLRSFFLIIPAHYQSDLIIANVFRQRGLNWGQSFGPGTVDSSLDKINSLPGKDSAEIYYATLLQ